MWYQIRKKVADIRHTLPPEIQGPFFNDEFGTTFGNIYALTGEGFDYAVLKDYADRIQIQLQRVKDVGKVELIGLQDEKVWIELSNLKLATLGVPLEAVQKALQEQNAVSTAGFFETPSERLQLRVSGRFDSVEQIRQFPIRVGIAPSGLVMSPRCTVASTTHLHRACASWARMPLAWRCR